MTSLDEALKALVNTIIRDCCESETSDPERDDTIMIREGTLREILERALLTTRQEVAPVAWGLMYPDDHAQRGQLWNVAVEKESAEQMQSACWNAGYDVIVPLYTSPAHTSEARDAGGFDAWWASFKVSAESPEMLSDRDFAKAVWDAAMRQEAE